MNPRGWQTHRRQILLFLIVILLPASVLAGLAVVVIRQDKERIAVARRDALRQPLKELKDRLAKTEMAAFYRSSSWPPGSFPFNPEIKLVMSFDADRLILPWEIAPNPAGATPQFASYLQQGEAMEFERQDAAGSATVYRLAATAARGQAETCEAQLSLGRVLVKTGKLQEATPIYREMMKDCGAAADDGGMRFSLYAAERLIQGGLDSASAYEAIIDQVNYAPKAARWDPPVETYLVRSLLKSAPGEAAERARQKMDVQVHDMEQVMAMARDFARGRLGREKGWYAYGEEPWLIHDIRFAARGIAVVIDPGNMPVSRPAQSIVVVDGRKVAPLGVTLTTEETPGSEPLGNGFSNIRLMWHGLDRVPGGMSASIYIAGFAVILGATLLGGYLLLRDVNRDIRMTEMRSHFVASVSHELKTPLTSIRMFAETLSLGRAADEHASSEYLNTIVSESERLARLVDNVLDFSRIEQGRKIYRMEPTALGVVVRSAARAMQYPLEQQGFRLNLSIDENAPELPIDADAVEQAILNLLSNAVKYSGASREIGLKLGRVDGEVATDVTDHGIGIARLDQTRIFEKFYRVHSAETDPIGGAGLGLTLVQHIVQAHGGRVDVQSSPGQGSTFSIRIPLNTLEVPA